MFKILQLAAKELVSPTSIRQVFRSISTSSSYNFKVAVCGAAGGIGQPLSLLLKLNPYCTDLALHDIAKVTPGVAVDLSHICLTPSKVIGYTGAESLRDALNCAEVVVIPAGMPRKPGMKREDLFNTNAQIVVEIVSAVAGFCPKAMIAIITNPVNSVVPIAAEVLKNKGVYDPNKLFGVTTLDLVRSSTFAGNLMLKEPHKIKIPVIGGHSGVTIIPLFTQCDPPFKSDDEADDIAKLTKRIQEAGTEVVKAKAGGGSATLSMAYAASRFINSLLLAMNGKKCVMECAYVQSDVWPGLTFFASELELGPNGIKEHKRLPPLSKFEIKLCDAAVPELKKDIQKGLDFAKSIGMVSKEKCDDKKDKKKSETDCGKQSKKDDCKKKK